MLNDAHLAAKREGERCVVVVDHTPIEEKRTAYAAELADAVELSVEIADYAFKNCRSATPRRASGFAAAIPAANRAIAIAANAVRRIAPMAIPSIVAKDGQNFTRNNPRGSG